ncbi:hypothetical protein IGI04_036227, partial [Brassica rapa subsp. trilocularis]
MAHKTTLTNQISPDPHVSLFIVQSSSSHPPLAEATEAGDEDGTENDETDVYVGLSDREGIEAGDEDGTGGVLTFHGEIGMGENVTERDEH